MPVRKLVELPAGDRPLLAHLPEDDDPKESGRKLEVRSQKHKSQVRGPAGRKTARGFCFMKPL